MLKEFFLVNYNSINSFKDISTPLMDVVSESFLLIASIFELFRGMIGKSNVESRVTLFILSCVSMAVFTQYNQKVLDVSFEISDNILGKTKLTSTKSLSYFLKSTPNDKWEESPNIDKKNYSISSVLNNARSFVTGNIAIGFAWLISVIAVGFSRMIFSVVYYSLVVLSPVVIFISVFPGFEGSLKAFWQTFIWCFLAPIVFSVTFVLLHLINKEDVPVIGVEQLINVCLYGIFLVGSFIMTFNIVSSRPIAGIAEKASMIGAMSMAAPFTGFSSYAQGLYRNPMQAARLAKDAAGTVLPKLSTNLVKSGLGRSPVSAKGNENNLNSMKTRNGIAHSLGSRLLSIQEKPVDIYSNLNPDSKFSSFYRKGAIGAKSSNSQSSFSAKLHTPHFGRGEHALGQMDNFKSSSKYLVNRSPFPRTVASEASQANKTQTQMNPNKRNNKVASKQNNENPLKTSSNFMNSKPTTPTKPT